MDNQLSFGKTSGAGGVRTLSALLFLLAFGAPAMQMQTAGSAQKHRDAGQRSLAQKDWVGAAKEFRDSLAVNPRQVDAQVGLGLALWGMHDQQGATAAFQRAIALNPKLPQAHFNVAVAYRELGEPHRALKEVKQALALRPDYEEAEIALGLLLQQTGQPDLAIAQYKQTLKRHPRSADAHNWLGVAYLQKNRFADAEAEFRSAIALNPKYVRAYNNLGSTFAQAGDFKQAIDVLRKAEEIAPADTQIRLNLGMALRAKGDASEALRIFGTLAKEHPDNPDLLYQLGQTLRQTGDVAGAISAIERALDLNGEMREAYYALALALKEQSAATRRQFPRQKTATAETTTLCQRGREALQTGDNAGAIGVFRKAVDAEPANAEAHNLLGFALARKGDLPSGLEELRRAVSLDDHSADAHYNLGVGLWYSGDRQGSRAELEKSLTLDSSSANTTSFLGTVCRDTGDLACAQRMFQRAVALNGNAMYPYFDLAVVFLREKRFDAALGQFESGLNLNQGGRGPVGPVPDLELAVRDLREAIAQHPTSGSAYNTLGRLLGLAGADTAQIVNAFETALRLQPDLADAANNLGLVYTQSGDDEKALAAFRNAIRIRPDFADAHQNLGTVLITSDAGEAIRELERAVSLQPNLLKAQYNLALAYDASPSHGPAKEIEQLEKLLALEPKYPRAEFALGKALLKVGRRDEAIIQLQRAVSNEPKFGEAYYQLGLALSRAGRKAEAAEAMAKSREFLSVSEKDQSADLDLREGRAALDAGRAEEAVAHFERVTALKPDAPEAHYYLGLSLKQKNENVKASEAFRKALELRPGYLEARNQLAGLEGSKSDADSARTIEEQIRLGRFPEAEQLLHRYLEVHPKSSWGWYALGYSFYGQHKVGESIRALAQSLQLDVKNAEAHKVLGRDLMMIGRFDAARLEFEQGEKWNPKSAEMPYNLGKLYSIQDNWAQAKESFTRAIALDPAYMEAYDGLGLALESLGEKEAAVTAYQKAIEMNEARHAGFSAPYVNLSALYNVEGDSTKGLELARRALAVNPKSDRALYQMAKAYERDGNAEAAAEALNKAIAINPHASSYFYMLATACRRLGRTQESAKAMEAFNNLSRLNNELEQKRIDWFKEEGNRASTQPRPTTTAVR